MFITSEKQEINCHRREFENNTGNENVNIVNTSIKNILSNYIPHEIITCDDRDSPWINKNIKQLILKRSTIQILSSKQQIPPVL